MKHIFIINPAAGKADRTERIREQAAAVLGSRGLDYEILISQTPGDSTRLAREAAQSGEELRFYACGGDGTLNEVINGIIGFDNAAVTHFPGGSGNDFIKLFDCPEQFRTLEQLLDGPELTIDLIECEADGQIRYADNICSMGLDARIGTNIDRYRRLPLVSGKGAYYLSTAVNLFKGIHKPYEVEINGEIISGNQTMICICNGQYYGGSFNPVPGAAPDDGILDVLIVHPVNLLQVAKVIGKYQKGLYADYPDLITHYRTPEIRISSPVDNVVNLDGEAVFGHDVRFRIAPHKIRFFYPCGVALKKPACV